MGTPAFKVREQVDRGEIILKSSNYALYGDMSSRFMSVLEHFSPNLEVYSIAEAFVDLSGHPLYQLESIGKEMKKKVLQWTGLPIGVGISTTKTLAKLANYAAKHYPATGGVVDLTNPVLDAINRKYGRNTLRSGSVGFTQQNWHMNQQALSQCCTTNWAEIVTVKS